MTIEQRIAEIERQLAELKEEVKEKPTGLIEAVNNLIELVPQIKCVNIYDVEQFGIRVNAIKQSLVRERRIAEKRDEVIQAIRDNRHLFGETHKIIRTLKALDEECAK